VDREAEEEEEAGRTTDTQRHVQAARTGELATCSV